jgi:hypothetical protein
MKKSNARSRTKTPAARSPKPPHVVKSSKPAVPVVGRRTARLAAGRTRPPRLSLRDIRRGVTAELPARTTARLRALKLAEELGVTLNKPGLRRATDRIEREMKKAPEQPAAADKPFTLGGHPVQETTERLPADLMAIHPSLLSFAGGLKGVQGSVPGDPAPSSVYQGIERTPFLGAPAVANRPSESSPLAQVIDMLDSRGSRLWSLTQRLEARLIPISQVAPPNGAGGTASDMTRPSNAVAALDQLSSKLASLGDFLETITERLLV